MSDDKRKALFETIDEEAESPDENKASKLIYDALRDGAGSLGGAAAIPADDRQLTESIREAATRRSQDLKTDRKRTSSMNEMQRSRPVPTWLWVAWAVAIVGAAVAVFFLW
ncbi:MAG: hypothetical protein PF961_07235 [Planctomycetota bacterium]|jgi:hypothetical protein|nr:hypothetical protein [Planctomycetota bacterium]